MAIPASSKAENHAELLVFESKRGKIIQMIVSTPLPVLLICSAKCFKDSAPSRPGLPEGIRSSTKRLSPNKDMVCPALIRAAQSK